MVAKSSKIPIDKDLKKCLEDYNKIATLGSNYTRQAVWPLYDYYMKVLRLASLNYFQIDAPIFKKYSQDISSRWNLIKNCIEQIPREKEDLKKYDEIIMMVKSFSNHVRHDDDFNPPQTRLEEIHDKAIDFHDWLSSLGSIFTTPINSKGMMKIEKRERFGREEWVIPTKGVCPVCGKKPSMIIQHWNKYEKSIKRATIQIMCEKCFYLIDTEMVTLSELLDKT
jgi:hypothetical protein